MSIYYDKCNKIYEYIQKINCVFSDKFGDLHCFSSMLQKGDVLVENYIIFDILELMDSNLQVISSVEKDIGKKLSHGDELRNNMALLSSIYSTQDLLDYLFRIFKISNNSVIGLREEVRQIRNQTIGHPVCYGTHENRNVLASTIVWNNIHGTSSYGEISYLYRKEGRLSEQFKKVYSVRVIIENHFDFVLTCLKLVISKIVDIFEDVLKKIWLPLVDACFNENYKLIKSIGFKGYNAFLYDYFKDRDVMSLEYSLLEYMIGKSEQMEYKLKLNEVIFTILNIVYEEESGILYYVKDFNKLLCRNSEIVKLLEVKKCENDVFYRKLTILFNDSDNSIDILTDYVPDNFADILKNCENRDKSDLKCLTYNYLYSKIIGHKYYEDFEDLKEIYSFDSIILSYFEKMEKYWYEGKTYESDSESNSESNSKMGYCEYHISRFYIDWLLHKIEDMLKK